MVTSVYLLLCIPQPYVSCIAGGADKRVLLPAVLELQGEVTSFGAVGNGMELSYFPTGWCPRVMFVGSKNIKRL